MYMTCCTCAAGNRADTPPHQQPQQQHQHQHPHSTRWRGRHSTEGTATSASRSHHAPTPTTSYSSFSSGVPRPLELPPLPLKLPPKHLYTCTVGRNRSQARCVLPFQYLASKADMLWGLLHSSGCCGLRCHVLICCSRCCMCIDGNA